MNTEKRWLLANKIVMNLGRVSTISRRTLSNTVNCKDRDSRKNLSRDVQ